MMRWLGEYARRQKEAHYQRGWDYAAGLLLRGCSAGFVQRTASALMVREGNHPFGQGVVDACEKWESSK